MKFKLFNINDATHSEDTIKLNLNKDPINLHEFNRYVRNSYRSGTSSAKTRGKVKCSTAKAYKQKGTGNARRGAKSSPLIKGGGVAHGPSVRSYKFKLNRKFINNSLSSLFSSVLNRISIVDNGDNIKTSVASNFLSKFNSTSSTILLVDVTDTNTIKAFGNCKNLFLMDVTKVEPDFLLSFDQILSTPKSFNFIKETLS